MIFESAYPPIQEPECGLIHLLFENRNIPEDRKMYIDTLTDRYLTFGGLKDSVLRFAAGLQDKHAFGKGDVLLLYSGNQYNYSIPLLGAVAAGGASSTANPNYTARELSHQLHETKAKVLIATPDNLDTALEAAASVGLPSSQIYLFGDAPVRGNLPFSTLLGERRAPVPKFGPGEAKTTIAYLPFSSGTTGKSKGVMTTHANLSCNILQASAMHGQFLGAEGNRTLVVLPFFHIFALNLVLHTALYWGTPVYVMPRFDLKRYCENMEKYKITYAYMVPPIVLGLVKENVVEKYDFSHLRYIFSAAAPLGQDLMRAAETMLPRVTIVQGYGLTESSPMCHTQTITNRKLGSAGVLVPSMTCQIIDESGKALGRNQPGEVLLKGPNIMMGYLNNPEATANSIDAEGYFHTGDVGYVDDDDHLYIVDRIKELIKYKGFQVPPAELEDILVDSPDVADCAVIGVYDNQQATELPTAYVTLKPNIPRNQETTERIKKFVADKVVPYKRLHNILYIDSIPKSDSGKILRRVLRDAANENQKKEQLQAKL